MKIPRALQPEPKQGNPKAVLPKVENAIMGHHGNVIDILRVLQSFEGQIPTDQLNRMLEAIDEIQLNHRNLLNSLLEYGEYWKWVLCKFCFAEYGEHFDSPTPKTPKKELLGLARKKGNIIDIREIIANLQISPGSKNDS